MQWRNLRASICAYCSLVGASPPFSQIGYHGTRTMFGLLRSMWCFGLGDVSFGSFLYFCYRFFCRGRSTFFLNEILNWSNGTSSLSTGGQTNCSVQANGTSSLTGANFMWVSNWCSIIASFCLQFCWRSFPICSLRNCVRLLNSKNLLVQGLWYTAQNMVPSWLVSFR